MPTYPGARGHFSPPPPLLFSLALSLFPLGCIAISSTALDWTALGMKYP
jgi:hypothetical protein